MDWTGILIGLIGGFVLSIIANFFTEPIKNWLSKRSVVSRSKRVSQLKKQQKRMTDLHEDKHLLFIKTSNDSLLIISLFFTSIFSLIAFSTLMILGRYNDLETIINIGADFDSLLLFVIMILVFIISIVAFFISTAIGSEVSQELSFLYDFDKNINDLNARIQELTDANQK